MRAPPRFLAFMLFVVSLASAIPGKSGATQYMLGSFHLKGNSKGGSASEPSIAVGPYDVFAQQQGDLDFYDKSGTPTYVADCPHHFYATLGGTDCYNPSFVFDGTGCSLSGQANDPVAAWDPIAQRFYALCMTNHSENGAYVDSHIHLAVSRSNRLSDGWYIYHIRTAGPTSCPSAVAIDRPILGFSTDKIVVYANVYACPLVRVFNKSALLSGQVTYQSHAFGCTDMGSHLDLDP